MAIEGGAERHIDYDPWGTPTGAVAGERQTFNAQEQDHDTKLFDLTDRKYDAVVGGFPSPDRLWEKFRSTSPYVYCANNPLGMTDPGGMQAGRSVQTEYNDEGGSSSAPAEKKGSVVGRVVVGALQDAGLGIFKSAIDTYFPLVPVIEFASGPKEYVGGYVTAFENATGQNGGEKAARFWLAQGIAVAATYGAVKIARMGPPPPRFVVTESGVAVPTQAAELRSNLQQLRETSTNPTTSRKFVGKDSQGPLRVRIEKAHPSTPGYTGPIDPLHTVDHLHIDRRLNGTSGPWDSKEKLPYGWPF